MASTVASEDIVANPSSTSTSPLLLGHSANDSLPSRSPESVLNVEKTSGTKSKLTPVYKATLFTLLFTGLQLSLVAIFMGYAWSHKAMLSSDTIWVSSANNNLLLLSTVISRVPPLIVPFVMAIAAYGFARDWLVSSSIPGHPHSQSGAPTPEQYHVAIQVIGNADFGAIVAATRYLLGLSSKTPHRPHWLTKSIIALLILTSLAYLVGGIDIWLHQAILPVRLTSFVTVPKPTTFFSRVTCPIPDQCPAAGSDFIATLTNTSSYNEVFVIPGTAIALLLPSQGMRQQRTYQASTFGMYTTCAPVGLECNTYSLSFNSLAFGCLEYPAFGPTLNNVPPGSSTSFSFNVFDINGDPLGPLKLGVIAQPATVGNVTDPQIIWNGNPYVVLLCEASILNIKYLHQPYHNNTVQVLHYELASPDDTKALTEELNRGSLGSFVDPYTIGIIAYSGTQAYASAYAVQISRINMASAVDQTTSSPTLVEYSSTNARGSQISVVPFFAFIVVNTLFAICVLVIGLGTNTSGPLLKNSDGRDVSAVALAQMRLTGAGSVIYEMFCTTAEMNIERSGCDNTDDLFKGDAVLNQDRIRVGVVDRYGDTKSGHFGISTEVTRRLNEVGGTVIL